MDSVLAVDFYGEVLREIVVALGAALFVANLFALLRRNADLRAAAARRSSGNVPAAPSARTCRVATTGKLDQAPIGRTIAFMVLGLFVAIVGIASLTA